MSLSRTDVRLRIEEFGIVPSIHPRATELAADNREQFLRALAREKDKSRARRAKASKKA